MTFQKWRRLDQKKDPSRFQLYLQGFQHRFPGTLATWCFDVCFLVFIFFVFWCFFFGSFFIYLLIVEYIYIWFFPRSFKD